MTSGDPDGVQRTKGPCTNSPCSIYKALAVDCLHLKPQQSRDWQWSEEQGSPGFVYSLLQPLETEGRCVSHSGLPWNTTTDRATYTADAHPPPPVPEAAKSPVDLVSGEGLISGLQVVALMLRSLV